MPAKLLFYLAETSFCLGVFALVYRVFLARSTYFTWNRWYLVGTVVISLLLPLLPFALLPSFLIIEAETTTNSHSLLPYWPVPAATMAAAQTPATARPWLGVAEVVLLLYAGGVLYRGQQLARRLWKLRQLIGQHPRSRYGPSWLVELPDPRLPAFSFGRFIFLSPQHAKLDRVERKQLLTHELIHVRQRHTADILLLEVVGALLWFNPVVAYLREHLKTVHEYLADAGAAHQSGVVSYGQLLIKLATQPAFFPLVHTFSSNQLFLRITMLTTPASRSPHKLRFLIILPVLLGLWVLTACVGSPTPEAAPASSTAATAAGTTPPIGRVQWTGNAAMTTEQLNQALDLRPGDAYDSLAVAERLANVTSLYMDQGHLFFNVEPTAQRQANGSVDLTLRLTEGRKAHLGPITFVGNGQVSPETLMQAIPLRSGDVFSRAKLLEAQKQLAQLGPFEATQVGVNPQPVMRPAAATDLVNVEFTLVARK